MVGAGAIQLWARGVRECALFAAAGFLAGGLDDLCIDGIWLLRSAWRGLIVYRRHPRVTAATLAPPERGGRLCLFVAAWQEEAVIGTLIASALMRLRHRDWRLYVGCYPNDPETIRAVETAARGDPHVRLVVGDAPGPTTKAGCLNWVWQALIADERREDAPTKAVILHDAEDLVHPDELRVYDRLIERFALVQLPVHAEIVRGVGRWGALVSGHYCGEFAEAHAKQVVVREAIGAAVPSAGVGCAIARDILGRIATERDGPFDPASLTEDYELGLRIGMLGARGVFVRLPAADGRGLVAVHACFPHGLVAAIRQKSRWMTGIALAGWDRLGWQGGLAERWMRLRDRRAPLAALVLAAGYLAMAGWLAERGWAARSGLPLARGLPAWLWRGDLALLGWRIAMRGWVTGQSHGWRMALLAPLHMLIGNIVAIGAAARAMRLYVGLIRHGRLRWDKTVHVAAAMPPSRGPS